MIVKSPYILRKLAPSLVWDIETTKNEIFLTFDDGPNPNITPWVLNCLDSYNAKATFFCVGENVCKYPQTFKSILNGGHSVGNHSYNHLNGWKTPNYNYYENINKARDIINSTLFRPPYGRITPLQIRKLKREYSIIMWSILSYDFDENISKEQCYNNSIISAKPGSIVVFHDNLKSSINLKYALPLFLDYFSNLGYSFKPL